MTSRLAYFSLLVFCATALAAARAASPPVEYIASDQTKQSKLPFSDAVRVDHMLYLSGSIGVKPGTFELVPGGIEAETRQALQNIKSLLEKNGSTMDQIVKCTVMMARMSEWGTMNSVYVTFFNRHFPARSAVGATGLALGASVEIECMATVR